MSPRRFDGFVHADGDQIVDADHQPLLLRGIGLGNWLLPEGYMWTFGDDMSSPRQIEARIEHLVGPDRARQFWQQYRDTFITETDIARIAELGFDHVRLPLNSRYLIDDDGRFLDDGFAYIDRLIGWCARHGIWVLVDLHGAPGGQTGTNIDDSPHGKPELFMNARYRGLTIRLWEEIARRYRHETIVLGYDLLNEPLPNEWQHTLSEQLVWLYKDLTRAIRAIDPDHLIVYEGAHWATNWSIFTETWDPNSMLQFHRYWCPPDRSSIDEYLAVRDRLRLPIYMGEGGENTPEWVYTAHRLYEQHRIGWNFWPWKKLDTTTSPLSARRPDRWDLISDPASHPDPDTSWEILNEFLVALPAERCDENSMLVNAIFGRPPLTLPPWGYTTQVPDRTPHLPSLDVTTMWHHTAGEPYTAEEALPVRLSQGDELRFALEAQPRQWSLATDVPAHLVTGWADGHLTVRALRSATLHGIEVLR